MEQKHLDNCVDLHESWINWLNYLNTNCELRDTFKKYHYYVSSNHHYIITPEGEVPRYFGYHGTNAWNTVLAS